MNKETSVKKIIGAIILATPVLGMYAFGVYIQGWIMATVGFLAVVGFAAFVAFGAYLLADE